jgi:hypothetical protein
VRALWLPEVLGDAGLNFELYPGWQSRGAEFSDIKGVIGHHTGAGSRAALRDLIAKGRSDLPGPLSQLFLDDTGKFTVIASGKSNHAGPGRWKGIISGNSNFIGIEAMNAGTKTDLWEPAQYDAYLRGTAAILKYVNAEEDMFAGHKEWALPVGRKVDPTFDMTMARAGVAILLRDPIWVPSSVISPTTEDPAYSMLQRGAFGPSVRMLQKILGIKVDGDFGPATETAVKTYQQSHGLNADGKVGPATWAILRAK